MSLWKRRVVFWQLCWKFFVKKSLFKNFLKGSAQFLRENTKLLSFFSEKNNLFEKVTLYRKNAFSTIGWRFIAKVWQFSAQELEKPEKLPFFKKKEMSLKTFIWAQRRLFNYHPKKRQKNYNSAENLNKIIHWIFFGRTCVSSKEPHGNVESSFDICADISLPKIHFFHLKFQGKLYSMSEKMSNCLFFPGKTSCWRCFSGQIKIQIWQSVEVVFPKSKNYPPKVREKFWRNSFTKKRQFSVTKPCGGIETKFINHVDLFCH